MPLFILCLNHTAAHCQCLTKHAKITLQIKVYNSVPLVFQIIVITYLQLNFIKAYAASDIRCKRSFHVCRLAGEFQTSKSFILITFKAQELNPPQNLWRNQWHQQSENAVAKTHRTKQSAQGILRHFSQSMPHVREVGLNFFLWKSSIEGKDLRTNGWWWWHSIIKCWSKVCCCTDSRHVPTYACRSCSVDQLNFIVQLPVTLPCLAYIPSATYVTPHVLVQDDESCLIQQTVGQNHFTLYLIFDFSRLFIKRITEKQLRWSRHNTLMTNSNKKHRCCSDYHINLSCIKNCQNKWKPQASKKFCNETEHSPKHLIWERCEAEKVR